MPIETLCNENLPYDVQVIRGPLAPQEVIEAQRRLYLDPNRDMSRPVLWDSRRMKGDAPATDVFRMVDDSTELWSQMSGGRSAILVGGRNHVAPARLYAKLAEAIPRSLGIFTSYEEAVAWLMDDYPDVARAS